MPKVYQSTNPNAWLGAPKTAQYTVPVTSGLRYGVNQADPAQAPSNKLRLVGSQITPGTSSIYGLVMLLPDSSVVAGGWTDATTTYATDTANAQSGTSNAFIPPATTTVNNGFIVGAKTPFNVLSVDITTAAGAAGAFDYAYWGQPITGVVGTANWQAVATNLITPATKFANATGENLVVANFPPNLMVSTAAGDFTGAPAGYYFMRLRATTATTTAIKAARIYAGVEIVRTPGATTSVLLLAGGSGGYARTLDGGIAVFTFWGTTNASHHVYIEYE